MKRTLDLINTINRADWLAGMWRAGTICALSMLDNLLADGWYAIDIEDDHCIAWLNGIRFEL